MNKQPTQYYISTEQEIVTFSCGSCIHTSGKYRKFGEVKIGQLDLGRSELQ